MSPENFYKNEAGYYRFIAEVVEGYDILQPWYYHFIKRLVDVLGALAGLLLLLPLLPFIILLIKLESPTAAGKAKVLMAR